MFTRNKEKIHFIGIGGIGMSAIASVVKAIGFEVSGSDLSKTQKTECLEENGIKVYYGHKAENIEDDVTVVVNSSAISATNEEIIAAKEKKITIISRGEMLAELMRLKYGIAVSGSHGKTTTTSLISQILACNDLSSEYMVCEADESDGSFLRLSPVINVVTNIDNDHLDYYDNLENLRVAFLNFINKVPFYGCSFLCFEDSTIKDLAQSVHKKYYSYGFDEEYDFYLDRDSIYFDKNNTYFKVYHNKQLLDEFAIPLIGEHNILNATASIGIAVYLNIDVNTIKEGLKTFEGVGRRLNKLYDKEVIVFDDYAHHPTEIKATLKSIKNAYKDRRIVAVFQPHRYSRTEILFNDFIHSFDNVDEIIITEIYSAGEKARAGISGEILANMIKKLNINNVHFVEKIENIYTKLEEIKKDNDIIITLGAGNISKYSHEYVDNILNKR